MEQRVNIKTSRELVTDIIASTHPEADLADEEVLFGIISDDYEKYAEMISSREEDIEKAYADGERNAREELETQRQAKGDGVPALGGTTPCDIMPGNSIFDLAAMA